VAYAKAHNGEGKSVIESDNIAIGYASVELAKLLAASGPAGEGVRTGPTDEELLDRCDG
jgi:hypothetical protein